MSELIEYAKKELDLIGMNEGDDMNGSMRADILQIVTIFADQGHSGFSASYAISALKKLLNFEPLSPLTGAEDEWQEVMEGTWQNTRCGRVFKGADGVAYDVEALIFREPDGNCYHPGRGYMTPIEFPYIPKTEYRDVPKNLE